MVLVSAEDAEDWRSDWHALLASGCPPQPTERSPRWPLPWFYTEAEAMALLCEPGAWIRFRTRLPRGLWRVGQVLARILPGETAAPYLTAEDRKNCWGQMVTRDHDRVLILVPGERKRHLNGCHILVNVHSLCAHAIPLEGPPPAAQGRLLAPLPPGAPCSWHWFSSRGPNFHRGTVRGFLEAGTPASSLLGATPPRHLKECSRLDRYLVDGEDGGLYGPAAHMVEAALTEAAG